MPPIVIAVSLPMTCAATCVTTSQITGLTLPGMIEEPFWSSGRISSPRPGARAGAHPAQVVRDLRERGGDDLERARGLDQRIAVGLRLEVVERGRDRQPRGVGEQGAHALGELGVRVQAGAGGGAAERDLAEARERVLDARAAELDLRGVAAELLAERDGHGVHEVRAAGLDDVGERLGLGRQRRLELAERGQQVVGRGIQRREVHGRGEDVVRRLAEVDVVVGVHALARERGHDLVGVHVRRRARSPSGRRRSGTGRRARRRRPRRRRRRCARRARRRAGRARR